MTRIPFQASGYTDGTSEGCKPSPLYTGPHCTCTPEGSTIKIDGELYATLTSIRDSGCPFHGLSNRDPERITVSDVRRVVAGMKGRDKRSDIDYAAQQWHNACLISAAPEMYEALEGIESLFGPDTPFILTKLHGLMTNGDQDKIDAVFGKIMHAIAKAQGVR